MSHNNYTHNTNNNYQVQIVVDPNATGQSNGGIVSYTSTGQSYYALSILPNNSGTPLFAPNFTVDGVVGEFYWDESVNPTLTSFPEPPPHGISSQQDIFKTFVQLTGTTTSTDNQTCGGPIVFDNSAYVTGAFQTDSVEITWGKIILAETYQDDNGVQYINGFQTQYASSDPLTWHLPNIPVTQGLFSLSQGYPVEIKAYVYLEYAPGFTGLTGNETINIDFDEIAPIVGCTNPLAENPTLNATIDDGSCTFSGNTYGVDVVISVENSPSSNNGPYTDGSTYGTGTYLNPYTTVNFSSGIGYGNIQLEGEQLAGTSIKTITLANTYAPGDSVTELVEFFVYPSYNIVNFFGTNLYYNNVYTHAGPYSGPLNNIDPLQVQRMFHGWGDSKNNLTAASLRIRQPFIFQNWEDPFYLGPQPLSNPAFYSEWHISDDPTGNQPTNIVGFPNFVESSNMGAPEITSFINATEMFSTNYSIYPGYEFFPEKVRVRISLDFTMPTVTGYNTSYVIPVNIYHNTENQGDLNFI